MELATRVTGATETTEVTTAPEAPLSSSNAEEIAHTPLYEMFKAEKSPRVEEMFKKIWSWAYDSAPEKNVDSLKWEVIKLKNRLGSPHIGEPPWAKVERWVSAFNDLKRSESRMKEMEMSK